MNGSSFSKFFGGIFAGVGIFTILVGAIVFVGTEEALPLFICGLIGFIFTCIGGGFIASAVFGKRKNKSICQNGTKYTGKIYGYTDDTSVLVNGQYRVNIKVHYFDKNGIEREAIIPTKF
ncbi:MAG: hypothetical protein MJ172_09190 [Clostridia bacterium]|nr:hypothetical protein [Clostridia bacterium]